MNTVSRAALARAIDPSRRRVVVTAVLVLATHIGLLVIALNVAQRIAWRRHGSKPVLRR
ncbi:hypothetical protein [Burkholderia sp. WAC0059]|uniref:hypothetical protein n=1 Tax=Burkholderia sp. WAC0059 TaxID=2066022 RepID=UPI0015E0F75A|nr:hypothetical protein [Burkholderia sp. WAC0059]